MARSGKTGPQPVVPPAPLVKFDSDEQMHTVVAATMKHHQEQGEKAVAQEQQVAKLDADIADLQAKVSALQKQLEEMMAERLRVDGIARQHRAAEDGFARAVAAMGAPYPPRVETLPGTPVWRDPYGPQPLEAQAAAAVTGGGPDWGTHAQQFGGPDTAWAAPDDETAAQRRVDALMAPPPPGSPAEPNSVWDPVERGGGS